MMRLFSLSVLLSVSVSFLAFNQEIPSYKEMIYRAYVDGKPELWKKEIIKLNDIYIALLQPETSRRWLWHSMAIFHSALRRGIKKRLQLS
ncbi:MAG: hypothetical protein E4G95_09835 [Bacteroidia bacterium]|nr:MAG: hypothetical protein E4G95_09835 [Bacteroidia bacterium]